ncbi:MAG TPA: transporter [Sulfitobacter sp.]|nr:transporter [Sulfitobacter sp.]
MKILFKKPLQLFALGVSLSLMTTTARSETLADALVSAYNHSGLLEQNRALLRAADEDVASASAALLPIVNWSAQTQRTFSSQERARNSNATIGVNAELLLYDFGGSDASIEAARESVFATRSQLLSIEQQIMLRAVTAYFNVRSTSKFVALRQNNLRLLTQELRAAKDRFDVGEVTRTDVALAEARLAQARSGLANAQGDLLTARAEYANVIGHQPRNLAQLPRLPRISGNVVSAQSQAVRNHPDMIATQHKLASLEYTLESTQAAFKPKIKTTGSLFLKNDFSSGEIVNDATVGLSISGPIFNGGKISSGVRRAMAERDAMRANLHVVRHNLQQSVANAYAFYSSVNAALNANQQQIRASRVAFRGVREEASLGARTTLDVLNAENELLNAEAALISTQTEQYIAAYTILSSTGSLTATKLGLNVQQYDPEAYYKLVKNGVAKKSKQGAQLDKVLRALQKD